MSTHLSLVNQKLGFASAMLLLASNPEVAPTGSLRCRAIQESVLIHLYSAFHFYLRELAEANGIKMPELISSLDSLINAVDQLGKHPSEVVELQSLYKQEGSWLSRLLNYYQLLFESPAKKKEKKAFVQEGMIELVELSQDEPQAKTELDTKMLAEWAAEFKSLVVRQRETGAEY